MTEHIIGLLVKKPSSTQWVEKIIAVRAPTQREAGVEAVDHFVKLGYIVEKMTFTHEAG
jgi:hypothetical protein